MEKKLGKTKKPGKKKQKKAPRVSYHQQPEAMSMVKWQLALRRQFSKENPFVIEKMSSELVYADYQVTNPVNQNIYKVALRSPDNTGANFCTCYDFRINRLGSCKHIESVFNFITKKRLRRQLKTPIEREYSSVYLDYKKGKTVNLRIGSEMAEDLKNLSKTYFNESKQLSEYGLEHFEVFLQKALVISPDFRCYDDALEYILEQREYRRRLQKVAKQTEAQQKKWLSGLVKTSLFPYQKDGVLFAYQHGRIILGDEMGLGKTVQSIAAVELFRREAGISKILILSPTSLKYQWKTEIEKFTDQQACVIEGSATVRHQMHREDDTTYKIASYHSALFDVTAMNDAGYDLIILDEAQRIKNWRTKIAQSVRKVPTRYVFVLTGTPIENNLDELYGLVQFVDPFALGPRHQFFPRYQTMDANGRVVGYENLGEIRNLLANHLIRRTKKQVLKQLPPRNDKNLIVPMTKEQRIMHRDFSDQVAKLVSKWQRLGFLDEQDRQRLLKNLNKMRMVCDSTYIIDQQSNHQTKVDELRNLLSEILEMEGEKVVVFSQWARMNDLVAKEMDDMGIEYRYLHGSVPSKNRGALYQDFNENPAVRVFLSTDAGGVGLNLQAAAWIINLDIPWNPGTLEQRIGRIYRLGQNKTVNIINLIAQGTIENNMLGVHQFKKSMAAGVLDDGDDVIFMGDSKFKKFMASVEVITRDPDTSIVDSFPEQPDRLPGIAPPEFAQDEAAQPEPLLVIKPGEAAMEDFDEAEVPENPKKPQQQAAINTTVAEPEALVQHGLQFFSQLARTLSDKQATAELVKTIVHKDQKTGQSYLKLPVENEQAVAGVLNLLGNLLKNI